MSEIRFEHHCWARIDLDALRRNYRLVKAHAGGTDLCAVVKADAYGHGALQCAEALADEGVRWFAVSSLREALQLRRGPLHDPAVCNILILGYTDPALAPVLAARQITQACHDPAYARALNAAAADCGTRLHIHIKADTGMGRIGYPVRTDFDAAVQAIRAALALPHLQATGIFQHFAAADETGADSLAYTRQQHDLFCKLVQAVLPDFDDPAHVTVHCDNSAGVMLHPDWPALPGVQRMARPGIILYGFDPSDQVHFEGLAPVMQLKTGVSQVKTLAAGESVSYGRHFTAETPTRAATLCAGYADGYPRLLSRGLGMVEIAGTACPVIGNVCMDQMLVDVSALPEGDVQPGTDAVLWGGTAGDSAAEIARKTGTIPYEVLCGVSRRVPRIYVQNGEVIAVDDFLLDNN